MPADLSPEATAILLHTLGLTLGKDGVPYRDHYVTGPTVPKAMIELVDRDLMCPRARPRFLSPDSRVFWTTDTGRALAIEIHGQTLPHLTRGQRRYRAWLRETDASGESFGAWLKRGGHRAG